jgi:hypothetical protein
MAHAVGWLAALNLAAWLLGSLPLRVLRQPAERSEFGFLYRLGFGLAASRSSCWVWLDYTLSRAARSKRRS